MRLIKNLDIESLVNKLFLLKKLKLDVQSSDIGIKWRGRKYPSFYYNLKFNNEYKINLTNGIILGSYDIDSLAKVNEIIMENKIKRNIDKVYLDIYTIDYNDDIKSSMERVFSE